MNSMILHYVFEHNPPMPDFIMQQVDYYRANPFRDRNLDTYQNFNSAFVGYSDRILTRDDQSYPSTKTERTALNDQTQAWVKNNICKDFTECSYSVTAPTSQSHGPHTDVTRLWLLMYIIDAGGDQVKNCFWQQKGYDKLRPENTPVTVCDYSELESVSEIQFPVNTWVLFNTKILHSVENIQKPRIAIHVGLNNLDNLNESFLSELYKPSQQTLNYALFL